MHIKKLNLMILALLLVAVGCSGSDNNPIVNPIIDPNIPDPNDPRLDHWIKVSLTPQVQTVAPGQDFYLNLDVVSATEAWDGYELVLRYNTDFLTYIPPIDQTQNGCLITGKCADALGKKACGTFVTMIKNILNYFPDDPSRAEVAGGQFLNCGGGIYLTAPGRLYSFHFKANSISNPAATQVLFDTTYAPAPLLTGTDFSTSTKITYADPVAYVVTVNIK